MRLIFVSIHILGASVLSQCHILKLYFRFVLGTSRTIWLALVDRKDLCVDRGWSSSEMYDGARLEFDYLSDRQPVEYFGTGVM